MTTSFAGAPAQALVAATIAFSAGLTTVALFGPIAKRLRDDMELDPTTLAFLIAVPSLAGSLLRIPFGAWADTVGGRLPNVVLLLTSIVGVLGLAIVFSTGTPSVAALSICGTMAGAGIACFSVGVAMVGYWYPRERQGTALGLYAGMGNMGPGLACLLVPLAPKECIPTDPGKTYTQIIKGIGKGEIRALWVICTNPVHSWIAKEHILKHWGKLEFLVVQDLYTTTQTAKLADLLLPAAGSPEKEGTFINSERRLGIVQKVMDPPGEALSDFEIVGKLAQAWGCAERFSSWKDVDAAFEIIREATKGQPCDISGIQSRQQLLESGGIQWPFLSSPEGSNVSDRPRRLFADGRFFHPNGRARFLIARVEPVPEIPGSEWPFWLLTGRGTVHQWHTGTRTDKVKLLTGRYPMEAYAELNPQDAMQLGVIAGDRVRISSRRGSVEADAQIAESTPPGAIFLPMHYEETNFLTYPAFDSFSDQPAYKMGAVKVEVVKCSFPGA